MRGQDYCTRKPKGAIDLTRCSEVTDVSALAGCASLHMLNLSRCLGVADASALAVAASEVQLELSQ